MGHLVEFMVKGGPLMYAVLLFFMCSGLATLIWAGLAVARKRVPSPVWLLLPLMTLAFGLLGRLTGQLQVSKAIGAASQDFLQSLLYSGLSISVYPEISGWGALLLLCAGSSLLAGVCHAIGAGKGARWSVAPGLLAGMLLLPGSLGLCAWILLSKMLSPGPVLFIPVGLANASVGVIAVGLRDGVEDKDRERMAAARGLVGFLTVLTAVAGTVMIHVMGTMYLHQSAGGRTVFMAQTTAARGLDMIDAGTLGLVAIVLAMVAGLIPVAWSARSLFKLPTIAWGAVSLMMVAVVVVMHVGAVWQAHMVAARGNLMKITDVTLHQSILPEREQSDDRMLPYFDQLAEISTGAWLAFDTSIGEPDSYWGYAEEESSVTAVAAAPSLPASKLLDIPMVQRRGGAWPQLLILTREPHYGELPERWLDSPYFEWVRLSSVRLRWLAPAEGAEQDTGIDGVSTGQRGEVADPAKGQGLAALLEEPGVVGDLLASAPVPDDLERTLYLVDGAVYADKELGLGERPDATWLLSTHKDARAFDTVDSIAAALASIVKEERPSQVVFVPGERWTVQDLVTLCQAVDAQDEQYASWEEPANVTVCSIDRLVPPNPADPFGTVARLRGTTVVEEARLSDNPTVGMGSLHKNDIEKVIRRRLTAIKSCYERALKHQPTLEGKITVSFTIGIHGKVTEASIQSSTMNNAEVEQCIISRFKRMRFPVPSGGGVVKVSYPFVFKAG